MTRIAPTTLQCFVCGTRSEQHVLYSMTQFDSPDLDGRPAKMDRPVMSKWIQSCPQCGYCAPDLTQGHESSRTVVRSPAYQQQLHAASSPPLSNRFLCMAMLSDAVHRDADAAQHRLHAAWAAENEGQSDLARQYRSAVADALLARRQALLRWSSDDADWRGMNVVFLVDLLRRASRFDEALREQEAGIQQGVSSIVRHILRFERTLIERRDVEGHSVNEALGGAILRHNPRTLNEPLLEYLLAHYGEWITPLEKKAAYMGRLRTAEGEPWATDDLNVLTLLARGKEALASMIEQRLLAEHPGKVIINRCPKCGGVTRTPLARQCRFCHHSWHEN